MARLPRLYVPGLPHHVIQRGNNKTRIVIDDDDTHFLLSTLREAAREHALAIHAYVVMPDHFHLVATPADEGALSRTLQALGRRYVSRFNRRHGRTGTLWEGRFRSTVFDPDRYLLACSRYVETNPVRAGLVGDVAQWPFSSYAHHVGATQDPLVSDHAAYWALANTPFDRQAAYRALFDEPPDGRMLEALRSATQRGWLLGDDAFVARTHAASNRRVLPARRGRKPRESEIVQSGPN